MSDPTQNTGGADDAARMDRADGISFAATTSIALVVYLFTLAPEITLMWSGVMSATALYGGAGPPAGYPVWTIYSWLFIKLLPFSNVAWRVAVGSAVAGAVACGFVSFMVSRSGRILFHATPAFDRFTAGDQNLIRIVCGCVAGLALGLSGGYWREAVVPEYWTFDALLFAAAICLLMRWVETRRRWHCWGALLVYGLLLTNNQALIIGLPGVVCAIMLVDSKLGRDVSIVVLPLGALVMLPSGFPIRDDRGIWDLPILAGFAAVFLATIVIAVVTRRAGSEWRSALACGFLFVLGLAGYFYLPIASMTNPPVNWAYPRSVEGFLHVVSRGQYERSHPTDNLALIGPQLWGLLKETGHEFGWLYLVIAALPFGFLRRIAITGRKWIFVLLPIFVYVGPLLVGLLNIHPDDLSQEIFEPYFFSLRVLLALFAGIGLMLFATIAASPGRRQKVAPA